MLEATVAEEDRELAVLIRDEADRIRDLVERMEVFNEKPIERRPINIHRVLEHVRMLAQSGFAAHIRFVENYDPSLPPVFGNRDQLVQVLLNLVKNAAEAVSGNAGDAPGRVPGEITLCTAYRHSVRLAVPGSEDRVHLPLMVMVRDNGPGVPEAIRPPPVRAVPDHESGRQWPWSCTCGQDRRRPWRLDPDREPSWAHRRPAAPAGAVGRRRPALNPWPSGRGPEAPAEAGRSSRRPADQAGVTQKATETRMTLPTVLVADDDRSIRTVLTQALGRSGYQVRTTANAATLWRWVEEGEGDLVITDVVMPDENGLDLIPRIKRLRPDLRVVVMSAQSTLMTAVKATQRGAFEYLPKPFDLKELLSVVGRALATPLPAAAPAAPGDPEERLPLIGRSMAMQDIYRVIARLTTADLTVMVNGESGTGKELVARALHDYGRRRAGPFVAINMAAIPRELIESELFGHERGAFTGATRRDARAASRQASRAARCSSTRSATCRRVAADPKLLRVLAGGRRSPASCGSNPDRKATCPHRARRQRDAQATVRPGEPGSRAFREDLYYRLNAVHRDRGCRRCARGQERHPAARRGTSLDKVHQSGSASKPLSEEAMATPADAYHWPGNVRELENLMRRLAALYPQETISAEVIATELAENSGSSEAAQPSHVEQEPLAQAVERHIRQFLAASRDGMPMRDIYDRVIAEVERPLIQMTLASTKGNQIKAAAMLGLNRNTLRKKIRDLEIPVVRGIG